MTPPQNLIPHGKTVYAGPRGEDKQRRQWRPYCITGKKTTHLPKAWVTDPTALFSPCPALATSTVPDSQHILAWPLPLLAFAVIYPSPSAPLSRSGTGHPKILCPRETGVMPSSQGQLTQSLSLTQSWVRSPYTSPRERD